jgi:hypothetical protein
MSADGWLNQRNASGWMFPNTIGGALDLDNLAERVIKPIFQGKRFEVERLARISSRSCHEPS